MKALEYLKFYSETIIYSQKQEIEKELKKINKKVDSVEISKKAFSFFNKCNDFIKGLSPIRNNQEKTFDFISEHYEDINDPSIQVWILKALRQDKTYYYAYVNLAQRFNRAEGDSYFPVEYVPESELLELLKKVKLNDTKNTSKNKKPIRFEDLFINPENAQKVKDILKVNYYTKEGVWSANKTVHNNHTGNKTELLAAYYSLRKKGNVLIKGKVTPQAKIFYKEFDLSVPGYISERELRKEPASWNTEIFDRLFSTIE